MIKQRIAALESITKQTKVPKTAEYEAATERALVRFLECIDEEGEHIPSQQEIADEAIIKAYENVYGKSASNGTYERYIMKLNRDEE